MSALILNGEPPGPHALLGAIDSTIAALQDLASKLRNALPGAPPASNCPSVNAANSTPRKPAPTSTLLTRHQMAELLACDARTLRRWEVEGEIPRAIHIGKSKRWRRGDIEKWLEGRRK